MPLYEYECTACAHRFDQIRKVGARPPRCPVCSAPTRKQISSPAIQFKGTGWYLTDYARKGKAGGSESGSKEGGGSSDAPPASGAGSAAAGSDAKASGESPAGKGKTGKGSAGSSSD